MAIWLGLTPLDSLLKGQPFEDIEAIKASGAIAPSPMLSESTWKLIVEYYTENAPNSLPKMIPHEFRPLEEVFDIEVAPFRSQPSLTMIHFEDSQKKLYLGNREGKLQVLKDWKSLYEHQFESAPSHLKIASEDKINVATMGFMEPNNSYEGKLYEMNPQAQWITLPIIAGLQRPVFFAEADFNNDSRNDFLISSFGYLTGKLSLYEQQINQTYQEKILINLPGALQSHLADFDGDGRLDVMILMAQGNEGVFIFYNKPSGRWDMQQVIRFPPSYGSSYMEVVDFDKDGDLDIITAQGDNGDYSIILKPYHGIRIFLNDGKNQFKETFFFPMYGCTKVMAGDFDQDGDLDLVAIAYFADYTKARYNNVVFIRNEDKNGFVPFASPQTNVGRWLVMESFDADGDFDKDILLGSCINTPLEVPTHVYNQWKERGTSLLILKNKLQSKKK
ncbi:MAG: FG-GAP repeat domain-containing protein [Runella sp.]